MKCHRTQLSMEEGEGDVIELDTPSPQENAIIRALHTRIDAMQIAVVETVQESQRVLVERIEKLEKTTGGMIDPVDDKVTDIHNVYSRIKQEANYKQGLHHKDSYHLIEDPRNPQHITNQEEEEEEDSPIDDTSLWQLICCCCACGGGKGK